VRYGFVVDMFLCISIDNLYQLFEYRPSKMGRSERGLLCAES
jgi:hypothetical protein